MILEGRPVNSNLSTLKRVRTLQNWLGRAPLASEIRNAVFKINSRQHR